jgi:hypothetical protein
MTLLLVLDASCKKSHLANARPGEAAHDGNPAETRKQAHPALL